MPENGIRSTTLHHAKQIKALQDEQLGQRTSPAKACVISETDASMVPIVKTREAVVGEKVDRRKGKTLVYREARLTLAHEKDSRTPTFSATLGDVKTAGRHLLHCVKSVGTDDKTKIHCVGDEPRQII